MESLARFSGIVEHGDGYGRKLGFPTANIDSEEYQEFGIQLDLGVYAGFVELDDGRRFMAGMVIHEVEGKVTSDKWQVTSENSKIPSTFAEASVDQDTKDQKSNTQLKLEAHLLDFDGDLYGQRVTFFVVRFLRTFIPFPTMEEISAQIGKDMDEVRRVLEENPKSQNPKIPKGTGIQGVESGG